MCPVHVHIPLSPPPVYRDTHKRTCTYINNNKQKRLTIAEGNRVFLKRRTESRGVILVIRAGRQIA